MKNNNKKIKKEYEQNFLFIMNVSKTKKNKKKTCLKYILQTNTGCLETFKNTYFAHWMALQEHGEIKKKYGGAIHNLSFIEIFVSRKSHHR